MTSELDLPHASLLVHASNPVPVIIRCKLAKNGSVENVRRLLALREMRKMSQEQLAAGHLGVSTDPFATSTACVHHVDTSSF